MKELKEDRYATSQDPDSIKDRTKSPGKTFNKMVDKINLEHQIYTRTLN